MKQVGYADWLFTATAGVIQPVTGFILIYFKGYVMSSPWWLITLFGYCAAGICWFPAIYLRLKCQALLTQAVEKGGDLSLNYRRYFYGRCALSVLALLSLLIVFYVMANLIQFQL